MKGEGMPTQEMVQRITLAITRPVVQERVRVRQILLRRSWTDRNWEMPSIAWNLAFRIGRAASLFAQEIGLNSHLVENTHLDCEGRSADGHNVKDHLFTINLRDGENLEGGPFEYRWATKAEIDDDEKGELLVSHVTVKELEILRKRFLI